MSGLKPKVEYTARARTDLRSIRQFGQARWGRESSISYVGRIREVGRKILNFPTIGRPRPEIAVDVRSFPVEEHVIFYRTSSTGVVVMAILHANSDIDTFLKSMSDLAE